MTLAAKFWRRKASTLSKNFLKAMSTQRSAFGSSEGTPSRTLVLKESGALKNEEQKEEAGPSIAKRTNRGRGGQIVNFGPVFFSFESPSAELKFDQHS
eukprot:jgi/Bigna1/142706/aug1.72_g17414